MLLWMMGMRMLLCFLGKLKLFLFSFFFDFVFFLGLPIVPALTTS